MTNSSREPDSRISGPDPVDISPKTGTRAPRAETSSGTAGDATTVVPRQFTDTEVFETLVSVIKEFESSGKSPTAAGVSARMRQFSPGFSVAATEFRTFRDLTRAAESAGIITATRTSSDYVLELVHSEDFRGATLLPDLWRAIQDWTEGVHYAFNRVTQKTEPVGGVLPPGAVAIPTVDKSTNSQWMRDFVAGQQGGMFERLESALDEEDPVAGFQRFMRENDTAKRRWSKYLRSRVLETAVTWAEANGIPRSAIFARPVPELALPATPVRSNRMNEDDDQHARRRVLDILASMPLHELLRLPIPLEYSLRR